MHTTVTDAYAYAYATRLGHQFYTTLATHPDATVAAALATTRHDVEQQQATAQAPAGNRSAQKRPYRPFSPPDPIYRSGARTRSQPRSRGRPNPRPEWECENYLWVR